MFYRDFMQKYRPLYAPDGASAATDGAAAAATEAGAAPSPADSASAAQPAPVETAPAAAPAASEAAVVESKPEPTLLEAATGKPKADGDTAKPADGAEAKKDDPAPAADKKPEADAKPEADKPKDDAGKKADDAGADPEKKEATAEEPPAPKSYEPFKLPEGLKLDDKELAKFTDIAGKAQIPQDVAQSFVDLYIAERKQDVELARAEQQKHWRTLNDTWKTELRTDPNLGGNRTDTSLSLAKAVVEEFGGTPDQQKEFFRHISDTGGNGMGNYVGFVRLLHNIGKALNMFEDGIVPAKPQAPKAQKGPGNRGWYDNSLNAPQ
jgi:hypothetical protein